MSAATELRQLVGHRLFQLLLAITLVLVVVAVFAHPAIHQAITGGCTNPALYAPGC